MATDWIKMRASLFSSPKLIAMARELETDHFRAWLGGEVSPCALRLVTGALLCLIWSWAREFGRHLENDACLLERVQLADLDHAAHGAPGVGVAMARVGWAQETPQGTVLPEFFRHFNAPMTAAEKQREYRRRQREKESRGEVALPEAGNATVTREEKSKADQIDVDWAPAGDLAPPLENVVALYLDARDLLVQPTDKVSASLRELLLRSAFVALRYRANLGHGWLMSACSATRQAKPRQLVSYLRAILTSAAWEAWHGAEPETPAEKAAARNWLKSQLASIELPDAPEIQAAVQSLRGVKT